VVTVFLVAVAMALALSHALELPGKMRLDKQTYLAMQPIYYPGFTIGGGPARGVASAPRCTTWPGSAAGFFASIR